MAGLFTRIFQRRQSQRRVVHRGRSSRFMDAAKQDALNAGWATVNYSADAVLRRELPRVRARSRYLAVNDPYYVQFLSLARQNVVGPDGIRLQMRVIERVLADGAEVSDARANKLIEMAWKRWGKRRSASYNQMDCWHAIEQMVLSSVARDGEMFIRIRRGVKNGYGYALELIEPDHVLVTHNEDLGGGAQIRMGIEVDVSGRVLAYHVTERHPGDTILGLQKTMRTQRIPADQMIHVFLRERVTQSRGVPWGVSSMARSKMLDGYEQAELVAARAGASKMGFIIEKDGEVYQGDEKGYDADGNEVTITDFDAGTFERLGEGLDVKLFDPQHPSAAFEMFTKRILRGISAGMGVGYNKLANDYEGVNYSSLRESNLSERDHWRCVQRWLIEQLHDEVFPSWLEMALTTGTIPLPIARLEKFNAPHWRPRGWQWVDPLKEMTAARSAIELGLDSRTSIAAAQGRDVEEIMQDLARENALAEKYGITAWNAQSSIAVNVNAEDKNGADQ